MSDNLTINEISIDKEEMDKQLTLIVKNFLNKHPSLEISGINILDVHALIASGKNVTLGVSVETKIDIKF